MPDEVDQEDTRQDISEQPVLAGFRASVLQSNNFSNAISLPLSGTPVVLATLTGAQALGLDAGDQVWLTGTIGWQAITNGTGASKVDVIFRVFRHTPVTGPQVFSTAESAEASYDNFKTISFIHVDVNPVFNGPTLVSYFLTAELPLAGSAATVIGPITFTAVQLVLGSEPTA